MSTPETKRQEQVVLDYTRFIYDEYVATESPVVREIVSPIEDNPDQDETFLEQFIYSFNSKNLVLDSFIKDLETLISLHRSSTPKIENYWEKIIDIHNKDSKAEKLRALKRALLSLSFYIKHNYSTNYAKDYATVPGQLVWDLIIDDPDSKVFYMHPNHKALLVKEFLRFSEIKDFFEFLNLPKVTEFEG